MQTLLQTPAACCFSGRTVGRQQQAQASRHHDLFGRHVAARQFTPSCSIVTSSSSSSSSPPVFAPAVALMRGAAGRQRWCSVAAAAAAETAAAAPADVAEGAAQQQQQEATAAAAPAQEEWCVLNFYHLVDIADPDEMLARHRAFIEARSLSSICGRIYISSQGINCQGGGTRQHAQAYTDWVASQPEFAGLFYTMWPTDGPAFPKLRLKHKPSLISLAGGMASLPCTDPDMRATPLDPPQWREKLAQATEVNEAVQAGRLEPSKKVVVMDLRNDYEWDAGHFEWADRPAEEVFAETPVGEADGGVPAPLQGVDPQNAEVMMYCTGGIRCDVYSALLRQKGFKNLYTLHGGIQNYLREEGSEHWRGSLFVFDGRMAINPPLQANGTGPDALPAAVPCQLCGASKATLPHVNCANIDCNELFIACPACKTKYHGCCCAECQNAPRLLRPIKINGGNYSNWGNYADVDAVSPLIAKGRRHEGRVARRARRREALKVKREAAMAEKRQLRAAMKAAVRAAAEAAEQQQGDAAAGKETALAA